MRICFDTETPTRYYEDGIPDPVCLTWSPEHDKSNGRIAVGDDALALWGSWIANRSVTLIAHNAPFDVCVMAKAAAKAENIYTRPGFGPAFEQVFRAYEQNRIIDTIPDQRLIDVAKGRPGDDTRMGTLAKRLLGIDMSDDKSMPKAWKHLLGTPVREWPAEAREATPWRYKYGLLQGVPLEDWPEGPRLYACEDPVITWGLRNWQEKQAAKIFGGSITNSAEQTRAALDLHMHSLTGFRTDRARVQNILRVYATIEATAADLLVDLCALCGAKLPPVRLKWQIEQAIEDGAEPGDPRLGHCAECCERTSLVRTDIKFQVLPPKGDAPTIECPVTGVRGRQRSSGGALVMPRAQRVKDRKAAQRLVWRSLGAGAPLTKTARERRMVKCEATCATDADTLIQVAAVLADGRDGILQMPAVLAAAQDTTLDALIRASSLPAINAVRLYSRAQKYRTAFLAPLDTDRRVRTSYRVCKDTGRTSARTPNCQNFPRPDDDIPRELDIRSCIIPDEDHVFLVCDYGQIELVGFAHILNYLGRYVTMRGEDYESSLSRAINAGMDGHIMVASEVLHRSYEETLAAYKSAKVKKAAGLPLTAFEALVLRWRQVGKIQNYGAAGGMGPSTFVTHASKQDAIISLDESHAVNAAWKRAWSPDIQDYFKYFGELTSFGGRCDIEQLYSGRKRGRATFTQSANTMFQGLCADGAKEAMRLIVDACFRLTDSPLYGCRPSLFVHDEFVLLARDPLEGWGADVGFSNAQAWHLYREAKAKPDRERTELDYSVIHHAERQARELSRLMIAGMAQYIDDVKIEADCDIMERWGKG